MTQDFKGRITDYAGEIAEGVCKLMVDGIGHLEKGGRFKVQNAIKVEGVPYGVKLSFKRLTDDDYDNFNSAVKNL